MRARLDADGARAGLPAVLLRLPHLHPQTAERLVEVRRSGFVAENEVLQDDIEDSGGSLRPHRRRSLVRVADEVVRVSARVRDHETVVEAVGSVLVDERIVGEDRLPEIGA